MISFYTLPVVETCAGYLNSVGNENPPLVPAGGTQEPPPLPRRCADLMLLEKGMKAGGRSFAPPTHP
jgi:hypothetical protein